MAQLTLTLQNELVDADQGIAQIDVVAKADALQQEAAADVGLVGQYAVGIRFDLIGDISQESIPVSAKNRLPFSSALFFSPPNASTTVSDGSWVPFTTLGLGGSVTFESLLEEGPSFPLLTLEFDLDTVLQQEFASGAIQLTVEDRGLPNSTSLGSIGNPASPFGDDPLFAISPSGGTELQPSQGHSFSMDLGSGVLGDFDGNGVVSAEDIDLLTNAIQSQTSILRFDLNGDAALNLKDHDFLITNTLATLSGDADLDRDVDFSDFLTLSEGFGGEGGWANGDFTADGFVDFADFLELSGNFGSSITTPVPEPSNRAMTAVMVFILLGILRRQSNEPATA